MATAWSAARQRDIGGAHLPLNGRERDARCPLLNPAPGARHYGYDRAGGTQGTHIAGRHLEYGTCPILLWPMHKWFERIPTRYLSLYVVLADVFVWSAALPFELYCRTAVATHQRDPLFLILLLLVNAALGAFVILSVGATSELVRRGFSRPVRE